ncbi:hypothetical protein [uncultured Cohaesibacter sp.]|uniref:hypothetical protein n=1 Tax=uncultured Cohaesibacter sp. TaxID=1002546 RepID=UPI0029C77B51|nr:hypothetical protein [uncultured Cohaesibacter sp.]
MRLIMPVVALSILIAPTASFAAPKPPQCVEQPGKPNIKCPPVKPELVKKPAPKAQKASPQKKAKAPAAQKAKNSGKQPQPAKDKKQQKKLLPELPQK